MSTHVVLGGSGLVGHYLLSELHSAFPEHRIIAITRSPFQAPEGVEVHTIDFAHLQQQASLFAHAYVYIALGTTMAKAGSKEAFRYVDYELVVQTARLAAQQEAVQLHVVSAIGANSRSKFFYNRVKGEMEDALQRLAIPSIYCYHPSILDGPRQERRVGEQTGLQVMKLLAPLMVGRLRNARPIHARQVAQAMVHYANAPEQGYHVISSATMQRI